MDRVVLTAGVLAAYVGGSIHACSPVADETAADIATDAAAADAAAEKRRSRPSPFAGWEPLDDYDPHCDLYVPTSEEHLPPAFAWTPCPSNDQTAGKVCREIAFDWLKKERLPEWVSPGTTALRRADGRIALITARFEQETTFRIVAEIDGRVLVAVREQDALHCVLNGARSDGEYYAFRLFDTYGKEESDSSGGGVLGGRLDELRPKLLRRYDDSDSRTHEVVAGAPGLLEVGTMQLHRWTDGTVLRAIEAGDPGLGQSGKFFHGDALFWLGYSRPITKQKVWTETGGTQDLVGFGADFSRAAADLGTDGNDLVWLEASGRSTPDDPFAQVAVVTAPFTTEPTRVAATKRVVRAGLTDKPFAISGFVVGCGYAARSARFPNADSPNGALVVRLSDGRAWHLPDSMGDWAWASPLALTCDELILRIRERPMPGAWPRTNVARVRLDSLGPGLPPP